MPERLLVRTLAGMILCCLASCGGNGTGEHADADTDTGGDDGDASVDPHVDSGDAVPDGETDSEADGVGDVSDSDGTDATADPCVEDASPDGLAGITWVTIQGGTFSMGSTMADDEQPVHDVNVPDFEMLQTEVTAAQYAVCVCASACTRAYGEGTCSMEERGNQDAPSRQDHPINCVSWEQAESFCAWIGGRLPSEAEWEYAARSGGRNITYPWGDEPPTCAYAVMYDLPGGWGCGNWTTMAVCSKPEGNTDQDLCDMAGNITEWVRDYYALDYTHAPTDGSAWEGPGIGRVCRGGDFTDTDDDLRAASRDYCVASVNSYYLGFRCAR